MDLSGEGPHFQAREALLKQINAERIEAGTGPVEWDPVAASVADKHCRAMCEDGYSSHWDLRGQKPYQRYFFGGVRDHVCENFGGQDVEPGKAFLTDEAQVEKQMQSMHDSFMAEAAPNDAHRMTVLDPSHTHVAIGVAVNKDHFRYIEVFLDRYLDQGPDPAQFDTVTGTEMLLTGKIHSQHKEGDWGPYGCTVYYEPPPAPLTADEASAKDGYPDFAPHQACIVWPWEITRAPDSTFMIPLQFEEVKAGHYYVQVHVRRDAETIPYNEAQEGVDMPGEDTVVATGLVMTYDGPTLLPTDGADDAGDGKVAESVSADAVTDIRLAPPRKAASREAKAGGGGGFRGEAVVRKALLEKGAGEGGEGSFMPPLELLYKLADAEEDGGEAERKKPITDLTLIHSADPEVEPPVGFEIVRVDIGEACRGGGPGASGAGDEMHGATADDKDTGGESKAAAAATPSGESKEDKAGDAGEGKEAGGEGKGGESQAAAGAGAGDEGDAATLAAAAEEEAKVRERYNEQAAAKRDALKMMFEALDPQPPANLETAHASVLDAELVSVVQRGALAARLWEDEALRGVLESVGIGPAALQEMLEAEPARQISLADLFTMHGCAESTPIADIEGYTYLCVRRDTAPNALPPICEVALVYGSDRFDVTAGYETIALPAAMPGEGRGGGRVYVCYRRVGIAAALPLAALAEGSMRSFRPSTTEGVDAMLAPSPGGVAGAPGGAAGSSEERKAVGDLQASLEAEVVAKRAREAKEAEERDAMRDRERLSQLHGEAHEERKRLEEENAALQKKLVLLLTRMKSKATAGDESKAAGGEAEDMKKKHHSELEKQYRDFSRAVGAGRDALERKQREYDRVAMDLQARLDEKEEQADEIRDAFCEFKKEIAKSAENSRTGRAIPARIISQFEDTEATKDEDVGKVRLKNIKLRTDLRKLERQLRDKEQLADGLHLIDFEQLKIENQTLNEKIEERNEELHKLRKKTTTTVQVLTHIKEKLQYCQAENRILKENLAQLDGDLTEQRDRLTRAKHDRDVLRQENDDLLQRQGFVNHDALVQDYEQRKLDMAELRKQLAELQRRHAFLTGQAAATKGK